MGSLYHCGDTSSHDSPCYLHTTSKYQVQIFKNQLHPFKNLFPFQRLRRGLQPAVDSLHSGTKRLQNAGQGKSQRKSTKGGVFVSNVGGNRKGPSLTRIDDRNTVKRRISITQVVRLIQCSNTCSEQSQQ
jgi:hypothetical protein